MLRIVGNACRLGMPQEVTDAEGRIEWYSLPLNADEAAQIRTVSGAVF
jgi:hypothetical protein